MSYLHHIALFGCPRSGTTWLGQIFNSVPAVQFRYQPLFSYEFKDWFGQHGLSEDSLAQFRTALMAAQSDFVLQALRPAKTAATHLVWKEVRYHQHMAGLLALQGLHHLVYIFRPPVDVLNSWYQAPKEFRAGQDIHREWLHAPAKNTAPCEFNGFEKWKESMRMALSLQQRHPGKLLMLSYEQLCANPLGVTRKLFAALDLPLGDETRAFLKASTTRHEADAYSVFKSQRTPLTLPTSIVQQIAADAEAQALLARAEALAAASSEVELEAVHE